MKVLLTGAGGFLGWHTRLRIDALSEHSLSCVTRENWGELGHLVAQSDAVIHVAGVNRAGPNEEVEQGNLRLADDLGAAILAAPRPVRIVYANSIQAGNGSSYGSGKERAFRSLAAAVERSGGTVVDVRLPNLFGEHGRPDYNSFVATFIYATIQGARPVIKDRAVPLLHVQQAAQALLDGLTTGEPRMDLDASPRGVQEVWDLLQEFCGVYSTGELPDLSTDFRVDLFNSYRAALFPYHYPIRLVPHIDERGMFVETVRCRGGEGQTSFSTTSPGVTRGEHYHLRKIERFAVMQGEARISLRRMFSPDVISFDVSGDSPAAVDMPTGWVHNITNTGNESLLTQFWSHELFDESAPDTFRQSVVIGDQS